MRRAHLLALSIVVLAGCSRRPPRAPSASSGASAARIASATKRTDLQTRVEALAPGARITIEAGEHVLAPIPESDTGCAACAEPERSTSRPAMTRGLRITGRDVHVVGEGASPAVLKTGAGYGIIFDHCEGCSLEGVTVTGGERDDEVRAADAAVVVKGGSVRIERCLLIDNAGTGPEGRSGASGGIAGLVARDGAHVEVVGCRIERNSGAAVFVSAGSRVEMRSCVIAGRPRSRMPGNALPRPPAVELAWDAQAHVVSCLVTGFDRGIAIGGSAHADIEGSAIEEMDDWGISVGMLIGDTASARVERTVVYRTGTCGAAVLSGGGEAASRGDVAVFRDDLFLMTGEDFAPGARGHCVLPVMDPPAGIVLDGSRWLGARNDPAGTAGADATFVTSIAPLLEAMRDEPALAESEFLRDFGNMAAP